MSCAKVYCTDFALGNKSYIIVCMYLYSSAYFICPKLFNDAVVLCECSTFFLSFFLLISLFSCQFLRCEIFVRIGQPLLSKTFDLCTFYYIYAKSPLLSRIELRSILRTLYIQKQIQNMFL